MSKNPRPIPPREFKPGTGLHKIWNKYADDGAQAALDYGLKEGLAQSSLLTWIKSWEKREGRVPELKYVKVDKPKREKRVKETEPNEDKPSRKGNGKDETVIEKAQRRLRAKIERDKTKPPKPPKEKRQPGEDRPITMSDRHKLLNVTYVKDKKKSKAYLITQGPEQSVVRFQHNGKEECIPNNFIGLPMESNRK